MPVEVINTKKTNGPVKVESLLAGTFFVTYPDTDGIYVKSDVCLIPNRWQVVIFKNGGPRAQIGSVDTDTLVLPVENISIRYEA